jgi:hypothetical protein
MLSSSLSTKHGFHTTFSTQIIMNDRAKLANCSINLLHILPARVFVDPYELANYKKFYRFRLSGTSHLELPVTAVASDGSVLLLGVLLPKTFPYTTQHLTVDVPLHVRYGKVITSNTSDDKSVEVPWPTGFWACPLSCKSYHATLVWCDLKSVKHLYLRMQSQTCQQSWRHFSTLHRPRLSQWARGAIPRRRPYKHLLAIL